MSLVQELKRRNVFRVAIAYVVTAWLLIEVGATLEETLHLPEWADSLLAMFLILGFPIALVFSWAYEITPEGIKRDSEVGAREASRGITARRLDWVVIVMLALAVAFFVVDRFVLQPKSTPLTAGRQQAGDDGAAGETAPGPPESSAAASDLSIAVLPFVNMSPDAEQEYFADGLTEELLNLLADIEQLKVAARTSSFYYKDKLDAVPLTEIARQLNVAHVLEGSVRRSGDRIRVTAQLIKANDGFHLWSDTWDRTLDDIFAIQDEIAAAVTAELKITLLGEAPKAQVVDTESWQLTQQARYLFGRRAEGDLEKALELFEQAVEIDPDNADAWVGMSILYRWLFDPPRLADALQASERAVALDPGNPEAWSRRAGALGATGDSDAARAAWGRAVELGDDNPLIQAQLAGQLGDQGDIEGAIATQKRAVALDPLHPVSVGNLASYLVMAGRLDEARGYADKLMDLVPDSNHALEILAQIHLLQGQPGEARKLIDRRHPESIELTFQATSDAWWDALIEHALGNRAAADAALQRFIEEEGGQRPVSVACLYAWRGNADKAFEWLDRALEQNPDLSVQWSFEPWLDSVEDDPRWDELMERWTGDQLVAEA